MIKLRSLRGLALALALLPLAARADTVTLKSGEKLEGKITSETDQEIVMQYKISPTISDERTIKKTEVASVAKASPDEIAFENLNSFQPGPNSAAAETYRAAVGSLQSFLEQFPQSSHVAEVQKRLAPIKAEQERIEGGEVKIGGRWLTKEQIAKERYQISASLYLGQMQDLARAGDLVGAMNDFDTLEKTFPGAGSLPQAIELARQVLPALKARAEQALTAARARRADREKAARAAAPAERTAQNDAMQREDKADNATLDAAAKARLKWGPFLTNSERSLNNLSSLSNSELSRVTNLPLEKMKQSLEASTKGAAQLAKGEIAPAHQDFQEAMKLWPINETATRLDKEAAEKIAAAAATPAPVAATPAPVAVVPELAHATPRPGAATAASPVPLAPAEVEEKSHYGLIVTIGLLAAAVLAYFYWKMKSSRVAGERGEIDEQAAERERQEEERRRQEKEQQQQPSYYGAAPTQYTPPPTAGYQPPGEYQAPHEPGTDEEEPS